MREQQDVLTVAFLPWFAIQEPISLHGVRFIPFALEGGNTDSALTSHEESLRLILSSYTDPGGTRIENCTVLGLDEPEYSWDPTPDQHDRNAEACSLLALAVIARNDYFNYVGSYANASQFSPRYQSFTEPARQLALSARRRDLSRLVGGYKHGEMQFRAPVECWATRPSAVDVSLVAALDRASTANSPLFRQLPLSLSYFNLANSDSALMQPHAEIVLAASAFEHVLRTSGRQKKEGLSSQLAELLKPYGGTTACDAARIRSGIRLSHKDGNGAAVDHSNWFSHQQWMWEFYECRNDIIHGTPLGKRTWGWTVAEHLVMAAFVFPLVVKLLLANELQYELTNQDKGSCRAIDVLLGTRDWHETGSNSIARWPETVAECRSSEWAQEASEKAWAKAYGDQDNAETVDGGGGP